MRYVLVALIVWTVGIATASALPMTSPLAVSPSQADASVLIAKRSHQPTRSRATARRSRGDGGIHPLVGSGDY